MPLEPEEAGNFVTLAGVVRVDRAQVVEHVVHPVQHQSVFKAFPWAGRIVTATGRWPKIPRQRAIALSCFDQNHIFGKSFSHKMAKLYLRPHGTGAIDHSGSNPTLIVRIGRNTCFVDVNIVAYGPVIRSINQIGKFVVQLRYGFQGSGSAQRVITISQFSHAYHI